MQTCLSGLTFQKLNGTPHNRHFKKKVNTCPHLISSDLKISNIHNQTLPKENNKVRCLSKTWINNRFIPGLKEKEKFFKFS